MPIAAPSTGIRILAALAAVFGILTIFSGGNVLFGPDEARAAAGNYVGFVLWFNFLAGWVYVLAAIGLWLGRAWALRLAALIAIATSLAALGFVAVALSGTAFEPRTVGAMAIRVTFWVVVAILARRWTPAA
ncbi:MAG: hypothetical protein K8F59_11825 [Rhodobacteraceae bacterium]|nr:hypothetical protein [Paracoccaceae bacterium]